MADLIGRKLVIVGDDGVGKSSLLAVFSKGMFPALVPVTYKNYVTDLNVDGVPIELGLWDTATQGDYDRLRFLVYPNAHVVLVCFAFDSRSSLESVRSKWFPELQEFIPRVPIILVGCKRDLREEAQPPPQLVSSDEAKALAESIGAAKYLQCSAKTGKGVLELFQSAAKVSLQGPRKKGDDCIVV
ncbi:transforming protein RhoA [Coprinopsis marcescibilis]|uniref:Transforming protein RhoA n=1 Tax=Coprinopsis marcescibilis TaxID=230819 RepID=A0A5C3KIS1_COPMA|nr:transforming protein RhoA [Coprinopsis marcescibilis]